MPEETTVPLPLFGIERSAPGRLSLMACPRRGARLGADLARLRGLGVSLIVSLLADDEQARLGLAGERGEARLLGIDLLRLPTPDLGVPQREPARRLAGEVTRRLGAGAHVVVHCRMGIGRSSTFAALVLIEEGLSPDEAWLRIGQARGVAVPETAGQRALVADLGGR